MARFRKKPVVVEAIQWRGDNIDEIRAIALGPEYVSQSDDYEDNEAIQLWNDLEGCWVRCPLSHWVIRGVKGEIYPCEVEVFHDTYDSAD